MLFVIIIPALLALTIVFLRFFKKQAIANSISVYSVSFYILAYLAYFQMNIFLMMVLLVAYIFYVRRDETSLKTTQDILLSMILSVIFVTILYGLYSKHSIPQTIVLITLTIAYYWLFVGRVTVKWKWFIIFTQYFAFYNFIPIFRYKYYGAYKPLFFNQKLIPSRDGVYESHIHKEFHEGHYELDYHENSSVIFDLNDFSLSISYKETSTRY